MAVSAAGRWSEAGARGDDDGEATVVEAARRSAQDRGGGCGFQRERRRWGGNVGWR